MKPSPAPLQQKITINGEPQRVPEDCSVRELLEFMGMEGRRVAVARNRNVVPLSSFAAEIVKGGDRIEILEAVGGG